MHQHFWTILHDSLIKRVTFRKNNFKTPTVNTLFECCSTNQVWDLELRVVYFIKPMLFYWRVMEHNQSNGGQSFITKAERKNPRYFEVIHNIRPRVTFFWILVNRSHSLFVWGVYSLSAHSWSFFSHNLPFLEFSTAFLTFTHCFHAEYVSASFWESVYRGGAIGSGPLFQETMLISPLVHRHWGEKTVEWSLWRKWRPSWPSSCIQSVPVYSSPNSHHS